MKDYMKNKILTNIIAAAALTVLLSGHLQAMDDINSPAWEAAELIKYDKKLNTFRQKKELERQAALREAVQEDNVNKLTNLIKGHDKDFNNFAVIKLEKVDINAFLRDNPEEPLTLLMLAAKLGRLQIAQKLIALGADVNRVLPNGQAATDLASETFWRDGNYYCVKIIHMINAHIRGPKIEKALNNKKGLEDEKKERENEAVPEQDVDAGDWSGVDIDEQD